MNENWTSKNPPELSDEDAEMLSAYIDNLLTAEEVAAFEKRLAEDAFLRSELTAMRQMLGWLKTMPTLKAPRNFTISEADVKAAKPKIIAMPSQYRWQIASAAAVLVVIVGFALLSSQLGLTPKTENVASALTQTGNQQDLLYSETAPLMATMGVPSVIGQNSPYNTGQTEDESQQENASLERSSEADTAMQESAPVEAPSTDGIVAGNSVPQGGTMSGEFGGDSASNTGLADTQVIPTQTSNAMLIVMPTSTVAMMPTQLASASEAPMNASVAQESTTNMLAMSATPMPITEPVAATGVEETTMSTMAETTADVSVMSVPMAATGVDETSITTMAETTEVASLPNLPIVEGESGDTGAAGGTVAGGSADTGVAGDTREISTEPFSLVERLNEIRINILQDILARMQR